MTQADASRRVEQLRDEWDALYSRGPQGDPQWDAKLVALTAQEHALACEHNLFSDETRRLMDDGLLPDERPRAS
jgi:hypothetical protein